jgi:hypothetical protein
MEKVFKIGGEILGKGIEKIGGLIENNVSSPERK